MSILPFVTGYAALSGGGQSGATLMAAPDNIVTTVAADHDSVLCPSVPGQAVYVYNTAAHILDVYPPSGGQIDALGANTPLSLAAGKRVRLFATSATQMYSFVSS